MRLWTTAGRVIGAGRDKRHLGGWMAKVALRCMGKEMHVVPSAPGRNWIGCILIGKDAESQDNDPRTAFLARKRHNLDEPTFKGTAWDFAHYWPQMQPSSR